MFNVWKKFLLVAALAMAAVGGAQAATVYDPVSPIELGTLGPTISQTSVFHSMPYPSYSAYNFTDRFNFSIASPGGNLSSTTTNFTLGALLNITNLVVKFYDAANNLLGQATGSPDLSFIQSLAGGSYYALVSGTVVGALGGSYTFSATAPVPLPAAVWLLAAGLAGLVGIARRKRPESAPLAK